MKKTTMQAVDKVAIGAVIGIAIATFFSVFIKKIKQKEHGVKFLSEEELREHANLEC